MARLILTLGGQIMAEYNMTKERYTVGRLPDNDVRIDNPAISGHHSLIINILNDSFLEDLNSTNGTYVNGKLIKKHALQSSDVITVGHHQLKFVSGGVEEEDDEFARTMIIDSSQEAVQRSAARAAGLASGAYRQPNFDAPPKINAVANPAATHSSDTPPRPRPTAVPTPLPNSKPKPLIAPAKIQVLSGSMAGRDLEINKTLTTLGRPGEQVIAITKRGEAHYIVQLDRSTDGPSAKVNGQELTGPARKLCDNDVIELLGVKMGFFTS
jgi:predicted component of type VI protein secretion system